MSVIEQGFGELLKVYGQNIWRPVDWPIRWRISRKGPLSIPEIILVDSNRSESEDCWEYTFNTKRDQEIDAYIRSHTPVLNPQPGNIAYYVDFDGNFRHVGKVADDGYVIAKWGAGNVYKGPPSYVPLSLDYGQVILYYEMPNVQELLKS